MANTNNEIFKNAQIAVVGLGYVGLSVALLLSQKNKVIGVDICLDRVKKINNGICPISETDMQNFMDRSDLNFSVTSDINFAINNSDFVILSVPTNYDENLNQFDTQVLEDLIQYVSFSQPHATIVVKSTIPVGFISRIRKQYAVDKVFFSPEFLREGKALKDNLQPSRIVVGSNSDEAHWFADLMKDCATIDSVPIISTGPEEAEAIKLFANTYLAMRVAYINELDNFAIAKRLDASQIINGICADPRIGHGYNNPSFGYGGYCLPKDTKQLLANFDKVPQSLITSIIASNQKRIDFIASEILKSSPTVVGIHRLAMKAGSDNARSSSVLLLAQKLREDGVEIIIYEPNHMAISGFHFEPDLEIFKQKSDIIISNRADEELNTVLQKVYTRDIFGTD